MEVAQLAEALKVVDSSISQIKWRLKGASKRRLETDILVLCTQLRPVVMVDYGGKMPELKESLCSVLQLSQKEASILEPLRVMVIEDMIYLLHVRIFAEYVKSSLDSKSLLLFVDLEQDHLKKMVVKEESLLEKQLTSIQKFFSVVFPFDGTNKDLLNFPSTDLMADDKSNVGVACTSQSSEFLDLSSCLQGTEVTTPTLNGWLLGYPVVYLFGKEHIADAVYNLSTKPLNLFKILVSRQDDLSCNRPGQEEELMSFTVPYDLCLGGKNEPWAETFFSLLTERWERCKVAWRSFRMEVSECYPQVIAL